MEENLEPLKGPMPGVQGKIKVLWLDGTRGGIEEWLEIDPLTHISPDPETPRISLEEGRKIGKENRIMALRKKLMKEASQPRLSREEVVDLSRKLRKAFPDCRVESHGPISEKDDKAITMVFPSDAEKSAEAVERYIRKTGYDGPLMLYPAARILSVRFVDPNPDATVEAKLRELEKASA